MKLHIKIIANFSTNHESKLKCIYRQGAVYISFSVLLFLTHSQNAFLRFSADQLAYFIE